MSSNTGNALHEAQAQDLTALPTAQTVPPPPAVECWVAREVYGFDNPRWLEFRAWMVGDAPRWFRRQYLRRGEGWANWLAAHPRVKPLVRAVMETILRTQRAK